MLHDPVLKLDPHLTALVWICRPVTHIQQCAGSASKNPAHNLVDLPRTLTAMLTMKPDSVEGSVFCGDIMLRKLKRSSMPSSMTMLGTLMPSLRSASSWSSAI